MGSVTDRRPRPSLDTSLRFHNKESSDERRIRRQADHEDFRLSGGRDQILNDGEHGRRILDLEVYENYLVTAVLRRRFRLSPGPIHRPRWTERQPEAGTDFYKPCPYGS